MTVETCRVSIRAAHGDTDLALCADLPLCEVIPSVVEATGTEVCGRDVHLARTDGAVLDAARSLAQSGVHDGEVLILTAAGEPPHQAPFDVCEQVADTLAHTEPDLSAGRPAPAVAAMFWAAAVVAVLLARNGFGIAGRDVGAGWATAITALVGAMALRRDPHLAVPLGAVAAALAGLTAQLAVPGLPGFLLAMSTTSATALLAWRLLDCGTGTFLPLAGTTMTTAVAVLPAELGWVSPAAVGPALATASLAVLAGAPRLARRLSGLSVSAEPEDTERRALSARRLLDRLVTSAAATSALGTVVTAVLTARPLAAEVFTATVAAILLLGSRTHAGPRCAAALMAGAGIAVSAVIGLSALHAPWVTTWLCGVPIAVAVVATVIATAGWRPSPTAERMLSAVELAAGAAVVPLACAAAGLFTAIRSLV